MEIYTNRTQELSKGLRGKKIKLISRIHANLSEEDKGLVEKYFDPKIDSLNVEDSDYIRYYFEGTDEMFGKVKVDNIISNFSKFDITFHVDGHNYLGNIQNFENATITALKKAKNKLDILNNWDGEEIQ